MCPEFLSGFQKPQEESVVMRTASTTAHQSKTKKEDYRTERQTDRQRGANSSFLCNSFLLASKQHGRREH
jgi:hypothetical protein